MYNPTPKPFCFRFKDVFVSIPPKEWVVVCDSVAGYAKHHYATLEVVDATEKEYKAFRKAKEDKEKDIKAAIEARKKAAEEAAKEEAKIIKAKRKEVAKKEDKEKKKKSDRLKAIAKKEAEVVEELAKSDKEREVPKVKPAPKKVKKVKNKK